MSTLTEVNMPREIPELERHEVLDRVLLSTTGLQQREGLCREHKRMASHV
jgi:hypothetical protein